MPFTGLIGRVAYAILAGVIAFLVFFILGVVVTHFDVEIGDKLKAFSPLIGLLVGICYFFARPNPTPPQL